MLTPCPPRSRSWPDFSQSVVELLSTDAEPEMIPKSEKRVTPEHVQPAWDDCLGLSPGHHLWAGVTNLMICNLPARCKAQPSASGFLFAIPSSGHGPLPNDARRQVLVDPSRLRPLGFSVLPCHQTLFRLSRKLLLEGASFITSAWGGGVRIGGFFRLSPS